MKRVYLYAFDDLLNVVNVKYFQDDAITIRNMTRLANWMREVYPESVTVYAIDNRIGLYKEFLEMMKARSDYTVRIEFADTVSREGLMVG